MRPIRLPPNQLRRFYRGGSAIARFRGTRSDEQHAPEDWVGSTTTAFGESSRGLSVLPEGRLLREAIAADPEDFLGPEHVADFGADPMLLVKLLDAGERLPVHFHPDRAFAAEHLGLPHGKTEVWMIVEARDDACVYLGFREQIGAEAVAGWVARQEDERMLAALNRLRVSPGDVVFVPAGLPHSIGHGVFLVELQEPSDLSVLLEWARFGIDGRRDGHLGLGFALALEGIERRPLGGDELARLHSSYGAFPAGATLFLPVDADPYFRAQALRPDPELHLEPAFSILVVLSGAGTLETERDGGLELHRGHTILLPYAAGEARLSGELTAVRCLPPEPS